ncbi:hypothetical protein M3J09_009828 [Ascochyta lentis]
MLSRERQLGNIIPFAKMRSWISPVARENNTFDLAPAHTTLIYMTATTLPLPLRRSQLIGDWKLIKQERDIGLRMVKPGQCSGTKALVRPAVRFSGEATTVKWADNSEPQHAIRLS